MKNAAPKLNTTGIGRRKRSVVLHVAPEAAAGGPLALVRTGDLTLDVATRILHLHVCDEELATRRAAWVPPPAHAGH